MHRLKVHKLGPIDHCELTCSQFMTFTGFQASGKSTIAKAIFYFRTIKDDIYSIAEEKALNVYSLENSYANKIDGVVITTGNKCDYLLMNEDTLTAYLIELKGSDLCWAALQLDSTEKALAKQLSGYSLQYRIVANKCKTQEIESAAFKKYRSKWKRRLAYKTIRLEENI